MVMTRVRVFTSVLMCALVVASAAPAAQAETTQNALRVLNSLPVSPERGTGYDRDFFRHWSDFDGDGCDTRREVLAEERLAGAVRGCDVVNGSWTSRFDGVITGDPRDFDIDHFVPLKEAWDSGAYRWSARERERFANDLGYSGSLVAVTASSNRSKSDRDPADWMPEQQRCWYAKTWIAVKYRWRLAVDTKEKSALTSILQGCSPRMRVPDLA
jgi:hypothetical protein